MNMKQPVAKLVINILQYIIFCISIHYLVLINHLIVQAQSIGNFPSLNLGFNPYASPIFGYGLGLKYGANGYWPPWTAPPFLLPHPVNKSPLSTTNGHLLKAPSTTTDKIKTLQSGQFPSHATNPYKSVYGDHYDHLDDPSVYYGPATKKTTISKKLAKWLAIMAIKPALHVLFQILTTSSSNVIPTTGRSSHWNWNVEPANQTNGDQYGVGPVASNPEDKIETARFLFRELLNKLATLDSQLTNIGQSTEYLNPPLWPSSQIKSPGNRRAPIFLPSSGSLPLKPIVDNNDQVTHLPLGPSINEQIAPINRHPTIEDFLEQWQHPYSRDQYQQGISRAKSSSATVDGALHSGDKDTGKLYNNKDNVASSPSVVHIGEKAPKFISGTYLDQDDQTKPTLTNNENPTINNSGKLVSSMSARFKSWWVARKKTWSDKLKQAGRR